MRILSRLAALGASAALVIVGAVGSATAVGSVATEAPVVPIEGAYKGTTTQKQHVYFGFRGRRVVNPKFTVIWGSCGKSTAFYNGAESEELDERGHFSIDFGQTVLEGLFVAPSRVEGTVIFRHHPLAGCPRRAVHYTAHLR